MGAFFDNTMLLWGIIIPCSVGIALGTAKGLLYLVQWDNTLPSAELSAILSEKCSHEKVLKIIYCCICGGIIARLTKEYARPVYGFASLLLLSTFSGCLLAACIMDLECCQVYNYVWWVGGIAGLVGLLLNSYILFGKVHLETLFSVIIYALLQELFFARFYGRADCHAFLVCGLVLGAWGINFKGYLIHMLLAFGVLGVIQLAKRNVRRDGNLKSSVPFLPYITASFWFFLYIYT